jgi:ribokinase
VFFISNSLIKLSFPNLKNKRVNMSIVVIGSSNTDMIIKVPRIPKPGETILGGQFSTAAGGKGANQAVAAARAGGNVTFITKVGDDVLGEQAIQGFQKDRMDVEFIQKIKEAPSGVALIYVDENGENSIAVASGANAFLSPKDIVELKLVISTADILLMQLEIPLETVELATKIADQEGVKVILNPAPAQKLRDSLLKNISIITPNETEAELLTGIVVTDESSTKKAADVLLEKGIETVIITLGSKGALFKSRSESEFVPGYNVKAVDTTAAGDVFNGALAVALVENKSLKEAIRFANAAAALSVTKLGAQPSAPKRDEIKKMLI